MPCIIQNMGKTHVNNSLNITTVHWANLPGVYFDFNYYYLFYLFIFQVHLNVYLN